jgi:hypothetical protein
METALEYPKRMSESEEATRHLPAAEMVQVLWWEEGGVGV